MDRSAQDLLQKISAIMPLMTAADFCDRNASQIGTREAVIDRNRRLTWSEVKQFSDRLALSLLRLGLKHDSKVLVQLPNCAELFLARLACEKAGIQLVTVTPTFRLAELAPIMRFTRPEAAIVPNVYRGFNYLELLQAARTEELKSTIVTGESLPAGTLAFEEMMTGSTDPEQLKQTRYSVLDVCQIATTSGSTGIPKCVAVPLYTRLLTGWIHLKRFGVSADDRLAAATSIVAGTADALVYNGGCASGAAVVLMDRSSPKELCRVMAAERVSVMPLVPTMMARIIALTDLSPYDLRALRLVINHGASLPASQGAEVETRLGCRIAQAYGSVDCGGISATSWDDPQPVRLGTLGRPLEGNEIRIVDFEDRDIVPGEVGRLWVRGLHTEARFFNNPELDRNRRMKGYFDLQELGRLDGDGNIVLMGREHDLIIRGGQNIFPGDVEATLIQHPKIMEVAVVGIPDPEMGERVCAFVVCDGKAIDLIEIKSFLEEKGLARFKWPERIEILKSLPRVASGYKVDKKKIKENFLARLPDDRRSLNSES